MSIAVEKTSPSIDQISQEYKDTEIGSLPSDWSVVKLQEASTFLDHLRKPIKSSERQKIRGKYPYYGASGVVDHINSYLFDGSYILLGEDGENIVSRNLPLAFRVDGKFWVNNHAHIIKVNDEFDITFLAEFLESLDFTLLNSGTAQPKLNKQNCLSIPVAKPPLQEQAKISSTLSDVDALITSLEKLIAKKRAIKTATLQQLLTGKTRLPPFDQQHTGYKKSELGEIPEDWQVLELRSLVSELRAGVSVNSTNDSVNAESTIRILKTSCINGGKFYPDESKSIIREDVARASTTPEKNTILFSRMNTPALVGEVGFIDRDHPDHFLPDRLWRMKFHREIPILPEWVAIILSYQQYSKIIKESATGTSGSMKNISKHSLLDVCVPVPDYTEQQKLASCIRDIAIEIDEIAEQLNKVRSIKTAMMQELLTGRTRLV